MNCCPSADITAYTFFKDFTPAIVAVIVGFLASYLSFRQWRIAREKLRLDLFDKRIKVFNGFTNKVRNEMGEAHLTQDQYSESLADMASIEFLFPTAIRTEMHEIDRIASEHRRVEKRWEALKDKDSAAAERTELAVAMRGLREDYEARMRALPKILAEIMDFAHITR